MLRMHNLLAEIWSHTSKTEMERSWMFLHSTGTFSCPGLRACTNMQLTGLASKCCYLSHEVVSEHASTL